MSFKLSMTAIILILTGVLLMGCGSVNSQSENVDLKGLYPPPPGSRVERIQPPGNVVPSEELYIEHIGTVLQQHIDLFLTPEDSGGRWSNLQVSQGFVTNGSPDTNARTFFVTHNGYYLGFLMVTYYDGTFISHLNRSSNENITIIISDDIPIAVIELPSGDVFVQTEDSSFHLTSPYRIPVDFGSDFPEIFDIPHEKAVVVFTDLLVDNGT